MKNDSEAIPCMSNIEEMPNTRGKSNGMDLFLAAPQKEIVFI